jgi:hypothetical protein
MIKAERRIDVDELAALAAVLGVTPDVLLAPPGEAAGDPLPEHAAAAAARQLAARIGDLLEASGDSQAREFASGAVNCALRRVQLKGAVRQPGWAGRCSGARCGCSAPS